MAFGQRQENGVSIATLVPQAAHRKPRTIGGVAFGLARSTLTSDAAIELVDHRIPRRNEATQVAPERL